MCGEETSNVTQLDVDSAAGYDGSRGRALCLRRTGSGGRSDPDIPTSHRDRVYSAEQYSNTVSVTDPASNTLLGAIRLGDPLPANLSPLYKGQLLVHGMGSRPIITPLRLSRSARIR